ncbi:heterokaryon incompatibility protein-domain-containing protein [Xylariaceae sp. FL0804]|nr:heterokaryon incompatibility protein-domain-containing protein [Xylariaceae sp. FL0804]
MRIGVEILLPNGPGTRAVIRTKASEVSLDWRHFNFYANPSLGATASGNASCKAFPIPEALPVARTNPHQSYRNLKQWIKTCEENHPCRPKGPTKLPTRVLKIANDKVCVAMMKDKEALYATLSHRWGERETFSLTTKNMDSMADDIPWAEIPRTYREAINITRELGIAYIWIDSLCIVQDEAEDWKRESQRMHEVYGNSYLNIAANQAADCHGGIFGPSDLAERHPGHEVPGSRVLVQQQPPYTHLDHGGNYYRWHGTPPLLQRGWVLQERLLPRRVVYYAANELRWECNVTTDCQCGGITVVARFKPDFHLALLLGGGGGGGETAGVPVPPLPLPFAWMRVAERYSQLELSYASDRLPALSGVAQRVVQVLAQQQKQQQGQGGGRYLAGLWEQHLAHQLPWRLRDKQRRPAAAGSEYGYRAPSWSWAAVFGSLVNDNRMDFGVRGGTTGTRVDLAVREARCHAPDGDGGESTTGRVTGGFLRVDGVCATVRAALTMQKAEEAGKHEDYILPTYNIRDDGGKLICSGFEPDYLMLWEEASKVDALQAIYWGNMFGAVEVFLLPARVEHKEESQLRRQRVIQERTPKHYDLL